jgi:hypothetical protein
LDGTEDWSPSKREEIRNSQEVAVVDLVQKIVAKVTATGTLLKAIRIISNFANIKYPLAKQKLTGEGWMVYLSQRLTPRL